MLPQSQPDIPEEQESFNSAHLAQVQNLRELVSAQINRQRHFKTTATLIDQIIIQYPDCPKFASMLVDRLLAGDEALAEALSSEGL
jgi:uncharacterized membrane-anchored protein YhcB (DUF1043 family)